MPQIKPDLSIKLKFMDEAGRNAFMLKAIHKSGFEYKLAGPRDVLISPEQALELDGLVTEYGGSQERVIPDTGQEVRHKKAFSHEERARSWTSLMSDLEQELSSTPYKLTMN